MPAYVATKTSRVAGDDTLANRTLIAAGNSTLILSVHVAADGAADIVNVQDAEGNAITDLAVGVDDTESTHSPFIIDNGLRVVSGAGAATTLITLFYRPDA